MNEISSIEDFNEKLVQSIKDKGWEILELKPLRVIDHTGTTSLHYATSAERAIQKHLIHYGLLYLSEEPIVMEITPDSGKVSASACHECILEESPFDKP